MLTFFRNQAPWELGCLVGGETADLFLMLAHIIWLHI